MDRSWWSQESIESIQTWHRECVSNHPQCCKTLSGTQSCQIESTLLPTRCIETLLVATQDGESTWRHVLRETTDQRGQYICLSHRWNEKTKTSKTTAANYMCRLGNCLQGTEHTPRCTSDIDWMPRLFADTCIFAHGLGIRYVWIDTICIRQDDVEEWNRESPQMVRYYQDAWATVVAADSAVNNGLLNMQRPERVPRMARLPYMDKHGEQRGFFYLQPAETDVLRKEFSIGVEESELLQRGWVFQEWRLSRRIIAFSDSDFFLYCHTLGSMSPMGDHLNGAGVQLGLGSKGDGRILRDLADITGLASSPSTYWENVVIEYSGLRLTCLAKDRFMALAGVASEVGRTIKGLEDTRNVSGHWLSDDVLARRYVCGLWLTNIHESLLWEQAQGGPRERLPGIPTWSWASMARHVTDEDNEPALTGLSARWPKGGFSQRQRQIVCAIHKVTTIPVDDQTWLPQFSNRPIPDEVPRYEYGNENRFVVLTIHSFLQPVQIENLLGKQDADLAEQLTSASSFKHIPARDYPWGMDFWRGICLPANPLKLVGWASVEHPELQSNMEIASCSGSIYALFVERCVEKGGLFRWSRMLIDVVVFTVLLVRRVTIPGFDDSFERVGVGRLFGKEVDKEYSSARKTTISLV